MKGLISVFLFCIFFAHSAAASSCYSGFKEGEDPDLYYAPDGTSFESSRECVKYAKSLSAPAEEKSSGESDSEE